MCKSKVDGQPNLSYATQSPGGGGGGGGGGLWGTCSRRLPLGFHDLLSDALFDVLPIAVRNLTGRLCLGLHGRSQGSNVEKEVLASGL